MGITRRVFCFDELECNTNSS